MTALVVLGAGGHGAVVAEAAVASGDWDTVGFLDDAAETGQTVVGCSVLGELDSLSDFVDRDCRFLVALGNNKARGEYAGSIEGNGGVLARVIHPGAIVSPSASIGPGCVVFAGAVINARAVVNKGAIVNTCASVDHDCVVGEFVHISPGAHVAGNVSIGNRSWLGIGAAVREGVSIGSDCVVGAGASVVSDIESGQIVAGVPARPLPPA